MKFKMMIICLFIFMSGLCHAGERLVTHLDTKNTGDLDVIVKKKYIRILTTRNPYDYYIYQGKTMGMQYEMAKRFTEYLNKKYIKKNELRIVFEMIPVDFDQLIPMLNAGKGDLIAVGLNKTPEREKLVSFTRPYIKVDDVIVTRKELAKEDWKKKVFSVQDKSRYFEELVKNKIKTNIADPNFNPADVMGFVSMKKYDYTLVNSFWADTLSKGYNNLHIIRKNPFRKKVDIGWAVRQENPKLLAVINKFLPSIKKGTLLGNLMGYKYFNKYDGNKIISNSISKYDKSIKKYSKKYNIDWKLLSALCFQESRFEQGIINKWGAIGLFQVKQMTADEPYINIKSISGEENYDNNIHAGSKYLAWIKNRYFAKNKLMKEEDKIRMALAGYNARPRRVLQAINLAKKMKLDHNTWFRNVELAMLKLGYPEPVIYVSEINKHYVGYSLLGIE
jgi:membrane-bound lytic murein transglycosylase MltF